MKQNLKLIAISLIAGLVLMLILAIVLFFTGNPAYILLFNFDYIPVINTLEPVWLFGYIFHFVTCLVSVLALFYILKIWHLEKKMAIYALVYTIGGGALFFLTALSPQPPAADNINAWIYWTLAHAVFGYVVGVLIKKWL